MKWYITNKTLELLDTLHVSWLKHILFKRIALVMAQVQTLQAKTDIALYKNNAYYHIMHIIIICMAAILPSDYAWYNDRINC